jgi:hypothetical protein
MHDCVSFCFCLVVTCQSVLLGDKPLETHDQYFFQLNTCGHSPYVTSSLMRGWVCHLQLLLFLTSAAILRFESSRTYGHILLSQILDSPNLEGQVPVFISPRKSVDQLYPQALGFRLVASYNSQGYSIVLKPASTQALISTVRFTTAI